jgi:hypothetical protein
MSTAIPVTHPPVPARRRNTWLAPALGLLIVIAYASGVLTGRALFGTAPVPRAIFVPLTPTVAGATFSGPIRVSGTGPDLIEIAERSTAVRHVPVTGTGPGLRQVADYGGEGH